MKLRNAGSSGLYFSFVWPFPSESSRPIWICSASAASTILGDPREPHCREAALASTAQHHNLTLRTHLIACRTDCLHHQLMTRIRQVPSSPAMS